MHRPLYAVAIPLITLLELGCRQPPAESRKTPVQTKALQVEEPPETPTRAAKKTSSRPDKAPHQPLRAVPEGPIAVVEGWVVSRASFMDLYELKIRSNDGSLVSPAIQRHHRKGLTQRLIYQRLLQLEAKAQGVDYEPKALRLLEAEQKEGVKDWERRISDWRETPEHWKARNVAKLREMVLVEKKYGLEATEADIDAEYEQLKDGLHDDKPRVRMSQLLISMGPRRRPGGSLPEADKATRAQWEKEAVKKRDEVVAQVSKKGADFEQLIRELSDGRRARTGGDLGFVNEDRLPAPVAKVAFSIELGKVSTPIRSELGYHIILVHGRYPAGDLPRSAHAPELRQSIRSRNVFEGKRSLKRELFAKYDVDNRMTSHIKELEQEARAKAEK